MNKIGFQNFRRFTNFQPIEYKGITFLVGRNNSGKSTLVKALLLINDFLKSDDITSFSFGSNSLEDANIVTYGRAKNRSSYEDCIKFFYQIDNYSISIEISGDDDKTLSTVHKILIIDISENLEFLFEPKGRHITISKKSKISENSEVTIIANIEFLNSEIERVKTHIDSSDLKKSSKEFIFLVEELSALERKKALLEPSESLNKEEVSYSVTTDYDDYSSFMAIFDNIMLFVKFSYDSEYQDVQNEEEPSELFDEYRKFTEDNSIIEKSFNEFYKEVTSSFIIYLGANLTKQSALFPIRDRNNALAQAIHDFYQQKISKGEKAYEFVEKWMEIFEIGETFEIIIHAGEAYEVIINSNGIRVHLADKGMGSIQAMLLILRLASIIYKKAKDKQDYTIVIEEPELNLHPALQSKLAELFHEVYKDYGIKLIVETHSEYLIRKTQLIVKKCEYEVAPNENPFAVLYFDKDFKQWKMEYREDGVFIENFGTGFFDVASQQAIQLMRRNPQTTNE